MIATLVAGLGLSGVFGSAGVAYGGADGRASWLTFDWYVIAVGIVFLLISYPLAKGREWARRILLVAVALVGACLLVYYAVRVVSPVSFSDLTPEQIKVERLSLRLSDTSSLFLVAAVAVFGFCFLSHPDVVATFHRPARPPTKV